MRGTMSSGLMRWKIEMHMTFEDRLLWGRETLGSEELLAHLQRFVRIYDKNLLDCKSEAISFGYLFSLKPYCKKSFGAGEG